MILSGRCDFHSSVEQFAFSKFVVGGRNNGRPRDDDTQGNRQTKDDTRNDILHARASQDSGGDQGL
jgi:hypothetical protein